MTSNFDSFPKNLNQAPRENDGIFAMMGLIDKDVLSKSLNVPTGKALNPKPVQKSRPPAAAPKLTLSGEEWIQPKNEVSFHPILKSFDELFELFRRDIFQHRDQLLHLNSSRRQMIERRLEVIARRIARARGEKPIKVLSLPDVLRDSFHDMREKSQALAALDGFIAEVALHNIFQIAFLLSADVARLRTFEKNDLTRLNFVCHSFVNQKTIAFNQDKCSWNFVRPSIYSWYSLSPIALEQLNAETLNRLLRKDSPSHKQNQFIDFSSLAPEQESFAFEPLTQNISQLLDGWLSSTHHKAAFDHLDFATERSGIRSLLNFLEAELGVSLADRIQRRLFLKRAFLPCLESGAWALELLESMFKVLEQQWTREGALQGNLGTVSQNVVEAIEYSLQNSLWGCEGESFETFQLEARVLIRVVEFLSKFENHGAGLFSQDGGAQSLYHYHGSKARPLRIPHGIRIAPHLGIELHNLVQEPLSPSFTNLMEIGMSHGRSALKFSNDGVGLPNATTSQGVASASPASLDLASSAHCQLSHQANTAAVIQNSENFDLAIVLDHIDRVRSTRWLKALGEQAPYWRAFLGSSSNLNWGELHLALALSKLKENGTCVFLSHRTLPDGGDGDRLRRWILSQATLEVQVLDLPEESFGSYRHLYVFKRCSQKTERDHHRVHFGSWREPLSLSLLEESSSTQWEISERGWDQVFVRGAAPLVRHLTHKFPKLFQVASVQTWSPDQRGEMQALFDQKDVAALEVKRQGYRLEFQPLQAHSPSRERVVIFPHNANDLSWLCSVLNSSPVQFWIKMQLTQEGGPLRAQDMRSIPVVDMASVSSEVVTQYLQWLSGEQSSSRMNETALLEWCRTASQEEKAPMMVALSRRRFTQKRTLNRYLDLFETFEEDKLDFDPERLSVFYPEHLLSQIGEVSHIRVQYIHPTAVNPNSNLGSGSVANWVLREVNVSQASAASSPAFSLIQVQVKQGGQIRFLIPRILADLFVSQLKRLRDFTWEEALQILRVPSDLELFEAQTSEIRRVCQQTLLEVRATDRVMEVLSLDLFEILPQDRQYLRSELNWV